MKTYLPKTEELKREWHEVDASEFTLGRLATRIAKILQGKHKPSYTPHMDVGDFVVVRNSDQIQLTGRKLEQKKYYSYSGYPGGITETTLKKLMDKNPDKVVWNAVRNMLPTNRLRKNMIKRLKFVKSDKHNYKIDHIITINN